MQGAVHLLVSMGFHILTEQGLLLRERPATTMAFESRSI
jgi:hypothetical protein